MSFEIQKKESDCVPIDVGMLELRSPSALSMKELLCEKVYRGRQHVEFGELFAVKEIKTENAPLVWEGNFSNVHGIGTGWENGTVQINGDAGNRVGQQMQGGLIQVTGNCRNEAGRAMRGGRLVIQGDAGDDVAAPLSGERRGMTGGEILIHGNAGNGIGSLMRRGLIAVAGQSGNEAGLNQLAGSIFLFGESGGNHGIGMKRGTIALFNQSCASDYRPVASFQHACNYKPNFLRLYLLSLRQLGLSVSDELIDGVYSRFCGDKLQMNRGEILVRVA